MSRATSTADSAAMTVIDNSSRALRLPTIRTRAAETIAAATRGQWSHAQFLAEILSSECDDRDLRARARRVAAAGFPRTKTLAEFDTDANPQVEPALLGTLAIGAWVRDGKPLCLIGDSGTGKSHLLIALGAAAAEAGHRVRYVLASRLVNELAEAENERQLTRLINRYGRVDLLCIDELGYLQLDRRGAELLFQVMTEREERAALAVASNEPFSSWGNTFTDPRLCSAIIDRITFNGTIIETGTTSYRLASTRANRGK